MNKEQQRIAIAELCGWSKCRLAIKGAGGGTRISTPHGAPPGRNYECSLPDYLNDLNAMHEAEKVIIGNIVEFEPSDKWAEYCYWLAHITQMGFDYHATASQRAEAFLRTVGKWVE